MTNSNESKHTMTDKEIEMAMSAHLDDYYLKIKEMNELSIEKDDYEEPFPIIIHRFS